MVISKISNEHYIHQKNHIVKHAGAEKGQGKIMLRQYSLMLLYCQLSVAALPAAKAATTCVCRTSYSCMYYTLKYSLRLTLFVYGCACPALGT